MFYFLMDVEDHVSPIQCFLRLRRRPFLLGDLMYNNEQGGGVWNAYRSATLVYWKTLSISAGKQGEQGPKTPEKPTRQQLELTQSSNSPECLALGDL